MWLDLCDLFCDIPQALKNPQPGLISDMADTCCCDDSIALTGTVATWKQCIIYCAWYITCNGTQHPCQAERETLMRALPVLFVDLWFICLRQPIMKQQAWFPLQSSEAATVTVPKYIRNVHGILWHFAFPTLPGGQRFLLPSDILIGSTCRPSMIVFSILSSSSVIPFVLSSWVQTVSNWKQ